jgi:hypothetical protein
MPEPNDILTEPSRRGQGERRLHSSGQRQQCHRHRGPRAHDAASDGDGDGDNMEERGDAEVQRAILSLPFQFL